MNNLESELRIAETSRASDVVSFSQIPSMLTHRSSEAATMSLLSRIPPERIGLNGEYDHFGLAKRTQLSLRQKFGDAVNHLKITQRGRVVICVGKNIPHPLMRSIKELVLSIDGCTFVEIYDTNGVLQEAA
jgi:hypothetical protein